ncbi:MAG TPA: NUDIX hydrolase [Dehalococcoidia bacterium]|jgi:ADP-ribose pyrophosphatase YjhB (NUDIX family)
MPERVTARFCIECGAALERREAFGKPRPVCPRCGHVHFEDPKVGVGVVATRDGAILLTRRNHEPRIGMWSFPAGFVDAYENVVQAAAREAWEETGVRVRVGPLLGIFQEPGSRVVFIAFAAQAGDETPVCGDECLEVRYFPPDALPPLAFDTDGAVLAAWRRSMDGEGSATPSPAMQSEGG